MDVAVDRPALARRPAPTAFARFDPAAHARDASVRATLQQRFGRHTAEGNVAWTRYRETGGLPGRFAQYAHPSAAVSVDSRWSDTWRTAASVVYAGRGSCTLAGARRLHHGRPGRCAAVAGAAYALSKRTSLFALYARLWNGRSATYNNMDGIDAAMGADTAQAALGVLHSF